MAIISGDAKAISKAQGIGAKTAQRIIIELKDKIDIQDMISTQGTDTEFVFAFFCPTYCSKVSGRRPFSITTSSLIFRT